MQNSRSKWNQWIARGVASTLVAVFANCQAVAQDVLSRAEALRADLVEAVQMLERKQDELLIYDFLPAEIARQTPRRSGMNYGQPGRGAGLPEIPEQMRNRLIGQLKAAQTGKITWNRDQSLAWVQFTTKPIEVIPAKKPGYVPNESTTSAPSGLGSEVDEVLIESLRLLGSKKKLDVQRFILGMLPMEQAAKLQNEEAMQRFLSRLAQHPEMIDAMARDFLAAKRGAVRVVGERATTENSDSDARVELQKVAGSWRLTGLTKTQLAEYHRLANSEIAASIIPAQRGTLVLEYTESRWKLMTMPTVISGP